MRMLCLIFVIFCSLSSCHRPQPEVTQDATQVSRRQLVRNGRRAPAWQVVFCGSTIGAGQLYRQALQPLQDRAPYEKQISIHSCDSVLVDSLGQFPLLLLGSRIPAEWQEALETLLPFARTQAAFQFGNQSYRAVSDLVKFNYVPNPWNTGLPLHLWQTNSDSTLLDHLTNRYAVDWDVLFWSSWGYELLQNGQARQLGFLDESHWQLDSSRQFAFEADPELIGTSAHGRYWAWDGARPAGQTALISAYEERYDSLRRFLGKGDSAEVVLDWYFYPTVERIGLRRRDMRMAQVADQQPEVHLVQNRFFAGAEEGRDVTALLRQWLGPAGRIVLEEGLSLHFTKCWRERGYRYWAARLYHSGSGLELEDLLSNRRFETHSELVRAPIAGLFVDFLLEHLGREAFLDIYRTEDGLDVSALQAPWDAFLSRLPQPEVPERRIPSSSFQKGFTFAHEGYRVFNGYGGGQAARSLDSLSYLQINALAIVPYSYMPSPHRIDRLPIVRQAGSENDEAVLFSHFQAQQRGWSTLMKPQIWLRNSWPGDIEFDSNAEWNRFFDEYEKWIRHYALLAEMYEFDALCIGTELVQTTLQHEAKWRALIQRIRGLYSGPLTYAANWGAEFEQLPFWELFDVIGLNGYYPMAETATATDSTLLAGARRIMEKAETIARAAEKPIWFTEIGYRSVQSPWQHPHAEPGDRDASAADQARAYAAFLQAVEETPEVMGFFWWKWPSYLDYSQVRDRGYHPADKPAAEYVRQFSRK